MSTRSLRVGAAVVLGAAAMAVSVPTPGISAGRIDPAAASVVAPGTFTRISVDQGGGDPNGLTTSVSLSADGRYAVFSSEASDLVAGDGNGVADVFRRDLVTGSTIRVSVDASGGDADGPSDDPVVSKDGRYVAFTSTATDLGPPDPNPLADVFVRDLVAGTTQRLGVGRWPSISDDGRYVAFSGADARVVDLRTGTLTRLSGRRPSISATGRYLSYEDWVYIPEEDWSEVQVFWHDLVIGEGGPFTDIRTDGDDVDRYASISGDGSTVVFGTRSLVLAPNPAGVFDVFAWSTRTKQIVQVSVSPEGDDGNVRSFDIAVDGTGRFVAFTSWATNLVPGASPGVFRRDLVAGTTAFVGPLGGGASLRDDGQAVAFTSSAALDPSDMNGLADAYVWTASTTPPASCGGKPATITGSGAIIGTGGADVIVGSAGNDVITALGGNDLVCAGAGDDRVDGGTGNDDLRGQQGNDTLLGSDGRDILAGSVGTDTCTGGAGVDRFTGCEATTP